MKVLFVSNLFPNLHEPARGVFNFHQVRHLAKRCEVRVVAPIAWFFIKGRFAPPGEVPRHELLGGLEVDHPRNFYLPWVGRTFNPFFFAASIRATIDRIRARFPFDVILVNWAYPDACGIARVARSIGVPFVVSISGSDANVYLQYKVRRTQILAMLDEAKAAIVRSRALKDLLVSHGVPREKVSVLYNGVDHEQFSPIPRDEARKRLNWNAGDCVFCYVGRLSPEKGVAELIEALAILRKRHQVAARFVAVGDGTERARLQEKARALELDGSVTWAGWKTQDEITTIVSASDFVCLASHMEGIPNAALEAFACGKPVVATSVGGLPEIVTGQTGVLAPPKQPAAFADAMFEAMRREWNAGEIRAHARQFDWDENARVLESVLQSAIAR